MRPTVLDGNITASRGNITASRGNILADGLRKIGGVHDARRGESRTQHRRREPMVRWSTAAF